MIRRMAALDGLRGIAAVVVVIFHYLCFLHPSIVPNMTSNPDWIADTPIAILWNGPFAVSIFFVLSGFVLAGAAERRRDMIVSNLVTRYLRLALPVLASVLLAYVLLSIWPTTATRMQASLENPSPWLGYTIQGELPSLLMAFYDGIAGNFLRGESPFNNVLWTMRIELLGSIGVFALYWMSEGRVRLILIVLAGIALLFWPRMSVLVFFAFLLGTLLYEASSRGAFENPDFRLGLLALVIGILLGAPGRGAAERWDFPIVTGMFAIGESRGLLPVLAAGLLLYAVLSLRSLAFALSTPVARWLGRISFALYLVHVPLLYTIIATLYMETGWPSPVLAVFYTILAFSMAHLFTLLVDEPSLRLLKRLRVYLQPWELPRGIFRLRRRQDDQRGAQHPESGLAGRVTNPACSQTNNHQRRRLAANSFRRSVAKRPYRR